MGWCRFEHTIYFQLNWKATMVLFSLWGLKTCLNELFELIHFTVFFSGVDLKILFKIPISTYVFWGVIFRVWLPKIPFFEMGIFSDQFSERCSQIGSASDVLIGEGRHHVGIGLKIFWLIFQRGNFMASFLGVFLNSSWRPLKISFMTSQTHSSLFFSTSRIPRTKFTWNIFVATETRNCCKWT